MLCVVSTAVLWVGGTMTGCLAAAAAAEPMDIDMDGDDMDTSSTTAVASTGSKTWTPPFSV